MFKNIAVLLALALFTACGFLQSHPAFAEDSKKEENKTEELPDSVVKAKVKKESSATIIEVPKIELAQSMETLPEQLLKERNTRTFYETLQYVSGIFNGGKSPFTRTAGQVSIRGWSGSDVSLDGAVLPKIMPIYFDAIALESVDILKGSTGSISGGQTSSLGAYGFGGSININTKKALDISLFHSSLLLSGGGTDSYRFAFDFNSPLSDGIAAIRVFMSLEDETPHYVSGDIDSNQNFFLGTSFYWEIADNFTLNLDTSVQLRDSAAYQGCPYLGGQWIMGYDAYVGTEDSRVEYTGTTIQLSGDWRISDLSSLKSGFFYIRADLDNTYWSVSTTDRSYSNTVDYYEYVMSSTTAPFIYSDSDYQYENIGAYTHYQVEFEGLGAKHHLVVGADWLQKLTDSDSASGTTDYMDISNPDYTLPDTTARTSTSRVDRFGILIQDFISFDKFRILIGTRLDHHEGAENDGQGFSPRLGVTYLFNPNFSIFGNISFAEAPNFGYFDINGDELTEPWTGRQFEIGTKVRLFDRAIATLSLYHIIQDNTPSAVPDEVRVYELAGEKTSQGLEISIGGSINNNWTTFLSYSYIDSKREEDTFEFDSFPPHSLSLWNTYQFTEGTLEGTKIGLGLRYVDDFFSTFRGGYLADDYVIDNYLLVDLSFSYKLYLKNKRQDEITFKLDIKNLLDEEYVESARHAADTFPGNPLTVIFSVSLDF